MTSQSTSNADIEGLLRRGTFTLEQWDDFLGTYQSSTEEERLSALKALHKVITDTQTAIKFLNEISGELDIDKLMDMVRTMALNLLDCERVTLFLVDDNKKELRGKAADGHIEPVLKVKFGEGIAGRVAQTGHTLNVKDVYQCPYFNERIDQLTGFSTRNILCCPISDISGKNIAVLEAVNKKKGHFSWNDENTLNLFVLQVGNTLEKSKLHQKAIKESTRIAALSAYTKEMHSSKDLESFLSLSQEALMQLIDAKHVFIFLADAARLQLWSKVAMSESLYSILRLDAGTGIVNTCLNSFQTLRFGTPSFNDPAFLKLKLILGEENLTSIMMHPIAKDDTHESFGVIITVNKPDKAQCSSSILYDDSYTDADEALIQLFCKDLYDLLLERVVEVSFANALSTVMHDGKNANLEDKDVLLESQLLEYSSRETNYMSVCHITVLFLQLLSGFAVIGRV